MAIEVETTLTITCDYCGNEIDPAQEEVFRGRTILEAGDGASFHVTRDATLILCSTDAAAFSPWAFPGQPLTTPRELAASARADVRSEHV